MLFARVTRRRIVRNRIVCISELGDTYVLDSLVSGIQRVSVSANCTDTCD
jgi:hypothetical protein